MTFERLDEILSPAIEMCQKEALEFKRRFGRDLLTIGSVHESKIVELEEHVKQSIPGYYRKFLEKYNPHRLEIMMTSIFGIKEIANIYDNYHSGTKIFDNGYLPIIGDNSGNIYCIQPDEKENVTLYIADHEQDFSLDGFDSLERFLVELVDQKVD